jgi:nucleoside-diphosphate-sugar epimerase
MTGASTVLNLAYPGDSDALRHAEALAAACRRAGVERLIHVSSCSVYGATPGMLVDEGSACVPRTRYERVKHAVEQLLYGQIPPACELVIVRPTAVFGPHGRNLESLARRVLLQGRLPRYVRACVMGRRCMNAVDVEGVAQALVMLASAKLGSRHEIFIISDDDYEGNDYRSIEDFFISRFSRPAYPVPVASLPAGMLRIALRAARRSNSEPYRRYSCAKLLSSGFRKPRPFRKALAEYAAWLQERVQPS